MSSDLLCNDIHSRLNPTRVREVLVPRTTEEVSQAVRRAERMGIPVSICGARHAMGGQQFGEDSLLLDLTSMTRIGSIERSHGTVEIGAGVMWLPLIENLHAQQAGEDAIWTIRQKQTGADDITLGGSLAANAHGRGLLMRPIIDDVEAFTLIDARGNPHRCSRNKNPELFRLAIGGYGCFGIITSICLRLRRREKLQRLVEITTLDQLLAKLDERIQAGCQFGDFQFSIDEGSADFLWKGVLSCYQPTADSNPVEADNKELDKEDWWRLIRLAHEDRAEVFKVYSEFYLSTHGACYWSDTHQLSVYLDHYHLQLDEESGTAVPASEMISELYVPRDKLVAFMQGAAAELRAREIPVIYGTVRMIQRDDESFLAWAREDYVCIIFNLHTTHDEAGIEDAAGTFRALIDLALESGGSYFLTYHRWARRDQIERAHPRFAEFLQQKEKHDPKHRFQSNWWRHHQQLFKPA